MYTQLAFKYVFQCNCITILPNYAYTYYIVLIHIPESSLQLINILQYNFAASHIECAQHYIIITKGLGSHSGWPTVLVFRNTTAQKNKLQPEAILSLEIKTEAIIKFLLDNENYFKSRSLMP